MSEPIQLQPHPSHEDFRTAFDTNLRQELGGVYQLEPKHEAQVEIAAEALDVPCGRCTKSYPRSLTFRVGATNVCLGCTQDAIDDLVFDIECPPDTWAAFYADSANGGPYASSVKPIKMAEPAATQEAEG